MMREPGTGQRVRPLHPRQRVIPSVGEGSETFALGPLCQIAKRALGL